MSKKLFGKIFILLLVVGLLFAVAPTKQALAAEIVHVIPRDAADWVFVNDNGTTGDWSAAYVAGPATPVRGAGSANINLTSTSAGITLATQKYQGVRLDAITTLSYSTYTDASPAAITFQINYDIDLNASDINPETGMDYWYGRLVYEPYMSGTAPTNGTWQTWNMLAPEAKWWASGNSRSTVDDACGQSNPCTLTALLTAFPNIGIRNDANSAIQFKAGSGVVMNGYVDNLSFGTAGNVDIYDFELVPDVVFVDDAFTDATPGWGVAHFATIQGRIDAVAAGGTVNVAAGTYDENPVIAKSLNLVGPNAGVNPNTTVRTDEAIIVHETSLTEAKDLVTVEADNVSIDGFLLDGKDLDQTLWSEGIFSEGNNLTVKNNIIKNFPKMAIRSYAAINTPYFSGILIENNKITVEVPLAFDG